MNKKLISSALIASALTCFSAYAAIAPSLLIETHQHTAEMDVSLTLFNKKKATVHLRIPTQQAYGFEGKAMNAEQEQKVNNVVDNLKANISQIISVGEGCTYEVEGVDKFATASEKSYEQKNGETKNIKTEYWVLQSDINISCNKDLKKKKMIVNFEKHFKDIDKIFINLNGSKERKFTMDKPNGEFTL